MNPTLAQLIFSSCDIAYAVVDDHWQIVEFGGAALTFFANPALNTGQSLFDLIPELIGNEDVLSAVLSGELGSLYLEHINRTLAGKNTRYLTLTLLPFENHNDHHTLLAILADTTEQGQSRQLLTQQRNELRLLRHQLDETNAQLNFLLRHYVPANVADALLQKRIPPHPGGELRYVTVLFADLRGYTALAEKLSPEQTMQIVNAFLQAASEAINQAGGTIVQFMGDAVMALFNAPDDQPDHALRAVQAGLSIVDRADALDKAALFPGTLQDNLAYNFGIGIYSGPAVVGNTGADWRYDYSAIGDTTNVAYRICTVAQARQVLIGEETFNHVHKQVDAIPLEPILLKGRSQALSILAVNGAIEMKP